MSRYYVNTDIDITLTIGATFAIADVSSMSVTLSRVGGTESVTLTSAGGGCIIGVSNVILRIPETAITVPGTYSIRITYTEPSGAIRGPYPDIEYLVFN